MLKFAVIVHDVAPGHLVALQRIDDALQGLLGRTYSLGVVPACDESEIASSNSAFRNHCNNSGEEILLHGYTHRNQFGGPLSWLVRQADEFTRMPADQACARVRRGKEVLEQILEAEVNGFVPPAWQFGPLTMQLLAENGISYRCGFRKIEDVKGRSVSLATVSWDLSFMRETGYLGELCGTVLHKFNRSYVPVIVLHPDDVPRGFLVRATRMIQAFLSAGGRPVTCGQLLNED